MKNLSFPKERIQYATLNIIFTLKEGTGIQELAHRLHINTQQLKPILEELLREGKIFETRSERKTTYHANYVSLLPELENAQLQNALINELKSHHHGETALRLAQRHKQPLEVIEANLQRAVMQGDLQQKRIGALRVYRGQA